VVALGKFDAMHKGHRQLAVTATQAGGHPYLISFSGMAEVLGWPAREPVVAQPDRARVLQSWAPHCRGLVPRQRYLPFDNVRAMSPEDFVRYLARDLRAVGVVAGCNYRFGERAASPHFEPRYPVATSGATLAKRGPSPSSQLRLQLVLPGAAVRSSCFSSAEHLDLLPLSSLSLTAVKGWCCRNMMASDINSTCPLLRHQELGGVGSAAASR
jgi:hypothetical protein